MTTESEVLKADDGDRTRDLELGKLALYQLSYTRILERNLAGSGISVHSRQHFAGLWRTGGDDLQLAF